MYCYEIQLWKFSEKPQFFVLAFLIKFVIVKPFLPFNPLDPCAGSGWGENMRTLRSIRTACKNFWSSARVRSSKCLNTEFWCEQEKENTKMILVWAIMNESPQTLWLSLNTLVSLSGFHFVECIFNRQVLVQNVHITSQQPQQVPAWRQETSKQTKGMDASTYSHSSVSGALHVFVM